MVPIEPGLGKEPLGFQEVLPYLETTRYQFVERIHLRTVGGYHIANDRDSWRRLTLRIGPNRDRPRDPDRIGTDD